VQNSTDTNAVRAGRGMFSGDFNLDIALISVKTGMTLKSGLGGQPTKVIENGSLPFENLGKLVYSPSTPCTEKGDQQLAVTLFDKFRQRFIIVGTKSS